MRELYNEYFYVPEHGKVRDKVMLTRITMAISVVVVCVVAMCISAYAYFTYNVTSYSSIIKGAHFETKVSIQIVDEGGNSVDIKTITSNYQTHKANLEGGKVYTVTIIPTENSTAKTGFVILTANGCEKTYHTQQLGVDESAVDGETPSITFKLKLTDSAEVKLCAHWGTSSYYDAYKEKGNFDELYITQNEEVEMIVNGVTGSNGNKDNTSTNTTAVTKDPVVTTPQTTSAPQSTENTTAPATSTGKSEAIDPTEAVTTEVVTTPPTDISAPQSETTSIPEKENIPIIPTVDNETIELTESVPIETTLPSEETEQPVSTETQFIEETTDTEEFIEETTDTEVSIEIIE